ncbi:MAG: Ig-like domain-containing protein, partial [Thermoproteota archaeon]|nr:Ig-like domain-containing protein [Thermoproteota archaeon]
VYVTDSCICVYSTFETSSSVEVLTPSYQTRLTNSSSHVYDINVYTSQDHPNIGPNITLSLKANDPDPTATLRFSIIDIPQHGSLSAGPTIESIRYAANPGFAGSDVFTYRATDNHGTVSNIGTVTIKNVSPAPTQQPSPPTPKQPNILCNTLKGIRINLPFCG